MMPLPELFSEFSGNGLEAPNDCFGATYTRTSCEMYAFKIQTLLFLSI